MSTNENRHQQQQQQQQPIAYYCSAADDDDDEDRAEATDKRWTTYTWKFENFSLNANEGFVASPHFTLKGSSAVKCYLTTLPNGVSIRNAPWSKTHTFIYLWLVSDHTNVSLHYRVAIIDRDGKRVNPQSGTARFLSNKKVQHNWQYNVSRDFLLDPANGLVVDDVLTVQCDVELLEPKVDGEQGAEAAVATKASLAAAVPGSVLQDLSGLLANENFSDVVLVVGRRELRAHKNILAARSPVFAAMFGHQCEESRLSRVDIVDLTPEVAVEMLRFMYTDTVWNMPLYAAELLEASDKYQLRALKLACERWLCTAVTVDSAAHFMLLAEMHGAPRLRRKCIDFILDHPKPVVATDAWTAVTTARPDLGLILFHKMVEKMDQDKPAAVAANPINDDDDLA